MKGSEKEKRVREREEREGKREKEGKRESVSVNVHRLARLRWSSRHSRIEMNVLI